MEQSLDLQMDALNAVECDQIFTDEGISGATAQRDGLNALLKSLKSGDMVVVWKLDRLGRSLSHLIETVEYLHSRNIAFCSIQDVIDTTTPGGRLYFHIMAALAEFERDLISERTKAGMAAAKARGVRLGRPPKLHATQIIDIKRRLKRGDDVQTLAKEFKLHPRSIYRYL